VSNDIATSTDHRSQVHTEVRLPIEAVVTRVIWFVFGAIQVLIAIRFLLLLFGANPEAGFVQVSYALSGVFMLPFVAVFKTQRLSGAAVFEWSALIAIAMYGVVAWGLVALVRAVNPRQQSKTVEQVLQDTDVAERR
jgi:hypothetical protein